MCPLRFVAVIAASAVVLLMRRLRKRRSAQRAIRTMFATQFEYDAAQARKRRFLAAHPAYGYPAARQPIDSWRPRELPGLLPPLGAPMCDNAMVYLDYAGAALPLSSQLARVAELASASIVLANPHSTGPAAAAAAAAIERARRCVLQHFCGARANEWELIWTSGATTALRIAAETFPFSRCGRSLFAYTMNAHTSVLGMRVPAAAASAQCRCVSLDSLEALAGLAAVNDAVNDAVHGAVSSAVSRQLLAAPAPSLEASVEGSVEHGVDHLIVLPAECNLTGDRPTGTDLPARLLEQMTREQMLCGDIADRYWVLLDASKAAASAPVHLPSTGAAMACVSLYKLFGEPTGLGALLVRRDLAARLRRDGAGYFGGGSVLETLPPACMCSPRRPTSMHVLTTAPPPSPQVDPSRACSPRTTSTRQSQRPWRPSHTARCTSAEPSPSLRALRPLSSSAA